MTDETKAKIDAMSYKEMLRLWRNFSFGHPMFQGEAGNYFSKRMRKRRIEIGNAEAVRVSKAIGWDGG